MSARFDPRDMDEDGRYISNAVLLEKINGFRTFYETRHSELMERVAHLEGVVKEVGEKAAERAAVLESREVVDRERIKTLFEANAAHKQAHADGRATTIAVVTVIVGAAGVLSYFIGLFLGR
jgi:hypothetical protein